MLQILLLYRRRSKLYTQKKRVRLPDVKLKCVIRFQNLNATYTLCIYLTILYHVDTHVHYLILIIFIYLRRGYT